MKNNTLNKITPQRTFHPGEDLKDELEARGMSQAELAKLMGKERSQLNEIIRGKRNMSADIALLLEEVLGISAEFWMNAQKQYELDKARINEKTKEQKAAIEKWNKYKDKIAVKFLKKQGYITGNPFDDIPSINEIYGIEKLEN
ncbi:MAG: HigA family addiction module antitoxin, partial [Bacteroidales bacterium]